MEDSEIVDVNSFFDSIILGYTRFSISASDLAVEIPGLPPNDIQARCAELLKERQKLTHLDKQLFNILELTGNEESCATLIA